MKGKLIIISLYILLALIVCATGVYWFFTFTFDDIISHYCGGVLRVIFLIIILLGIILPILKYRKYRQKWVLPLVLSFIMLITPIFNNGILKFVEDSLEIYSKDKWEDNEYLRIYMLSIC